MKIVILPRDTFTSIIDVVRYDEVYFGNVLANNADVDNLIEWDPTKTDYKYLDEVVISELNTKYTATVDNPVGHPSTSTGWFGEGTNSKRLSDNMFTSQSLYSSDAVIDFDVIGMDMLIGQNIENVDDVYIYAINDDNSDGTLLYSENMTSIEAYSYDTCCNPAPTKKTKIVINLYDFLTCNTGSKIRVKMTKTVGASFIGIGTLAVGWSYDLGCVLRGAELTTEIPENVTEFEAIRQTGVRPANITRRLKTTVSVPTTKADEIDDILTKNGAYLNFYVLDDEDKIKNAVILGRCTRIGVPIDGTTHTQIPIEVFGIEK